MKPPVAENGARAKDVALDVPSPLPDPRPASGCPACSPLVNLDVLPPEVQERLAELLEGYLEELELGLSPDAEELVARHPDLAGAIRAHLAGLDFVYRATAPCGPPQPLGRRLARGPSGNWAITRLCGRSAAAAWAWSMRPGRYRWTAAWH